MSFKLKQVIWTATIFIVAVLLWRLWVPELLLFEAPGWDEADRANDALTVFRGLAHANPIPLFMQVVFFNTWGPLFSVFAQIPLALFGANAQSLTFISFFALVLGSFGGLLFVQRRLGWAAALAISFFAFAWMVSATDFSAYWIIFMTDSWLVAGFTLVVFAGVCADIWLLIIGLWLVFGMKYQYYPVYFVTVVAYFLWTGRRNLLEFAREFLRPWWAKTLLAVALLGLAHVVIMKTAGAVYGAESWAQPRALRNPVHISFLLATILVFAQRRSIFQWLVKQEWEKTFVRYFFWPATALMAFPWPNRWAGVMVTQDYQAESNKNLIGTIGLYAREIASGLSWPMTLVSILFTLVVLFVGFVAWRSRRGFKLATLPSFVSLLIIVQILVLLAGVKNTQTRFAFAVYLSVPVGLFAYVISQFGGRTRVILSSVLSVLILGALLTPSFFNPRDFFVARMKFHTNETYYLHTALYPLDLSLGPLVAQASRQLSEASSGAGASASQNKPFREVRLGIVDIAARELFDRSMKLWPIEFELHTGVASDVRVYAENEDYCAKSLADARDLLVRPVGGKWETVTCDVP